MSPDDGQRMDDQTDEEASLGEYSPDVDLHELPLPVQQCVDTIAAAHQNGGTDESALKRLTTWLEIHSTDIIAQAVDERVAAVSPDRLHTPDDDEVREFLGLDEDDDVTDEDRSAWAVSRIESLLEDADDSGTFSPVELTTSDGDVLTFVVEVRGYSFSGVDYTWHGPYDDFDAFLTDFADQGWLTSASDFTSLPLEEQMRRLGD